VDAATRRLSFSLADPKRSQPRSAAVFLGEDLHFTRRRGSQGKARGDLSRAKWRISRYHGLLHLLGTTITPSCARRILALERRLMRALSWRIAKL